ncbi:Ku protein [Actinoplanes sp. NPDC049316]|uniref:non-homologous end joining protein Ku n=1 Tax=Actinoplanes sp. NPDC049316 TaxID=3154727 RepID=UPI0034232FA2
MARPIWTGSITFGLVSVPVGLYSATHEHEVSFHQFEKGATDRIRLRRVNERTGKDVEYDDIVKGTDVGGGELVMLDQEELDSVAPGRSRSLEIHQFVDLDEIDPLYYQKTYYLAPGSDETMKTYALLRDAMADANRAAVGTLVMRGKEYLAAIRPDDDLLVLQTMYFADEVRDPEKELDRVPGASKAKPAELSMAAQLIDSMSGPWKPEEYRDTYTDRVNELIEAKKAGREVTVAEEAPEPTNVTDLLEVLRRSVEAAKKSTAKKPAKKTAAKKTAAKKAAPPKKATPAKKTAAKKTAAKKSTAATKTARKRAS